MRPPLGTTRTMYYMKPPKLKKRKVEEEDSLEKAEGTSHNDNEEPKEGDSDEWTSCDSDEEEEEDDSWSGESDESEEEAVTEEEVVEEKKPRKKESSVVTKLHEGDEVSMDYCSKNLYKGKIENIKGMLDDSKLHVEPEDKPDTRPAFKNVSRKWSWKQEVALIEGVETHGLFNWDTIAAQLSGQHHKKIFKAEEVKNHYYQYYFHGTLGQVWNYQLEKQPLKCFDHTDPVVVCSTNKYLPPIAPKTLRELKFLPHREDFEKFPPTAIEKILTKVDFSSYYMTFLKTFKIDQEVRALQLVIVDRFRELVADRLKEYQLMKDYKLIEQFFNMDNKITRKCEVEKHFQSLQKFVRYFDSPDDFIKFYYNCVKEKLLKLEIARLTQMLATRRKKERDPEFKVMLKQRAPSFLDVGLLLKANKDFILQKSKKRKKKFKFTQRKRAR